MWIQNTAWLPTLPQSHPGYCYRVASYHVSHVLRPFSDVLCVPIWVLITPNSSTSALCHTLVTTDKIVTWNCLSPLHIGSRLLLSCAGLPETIHLNYDWLPFMPKKLRILLLPALPSRCNDIYNEYQWPEYRYSLINSLLVSTLERPHKKKIT
jgi:hypothetical protein